MRSRLARRRLQEELMDQPDLPADQHRQALRGLDRINGWSRTASGLWNVVERHLPVAHHRSATSPVRLLDVATGGGGIPCALARRASQAGLPFAAAGCDRSPTALAYAREKAASLDVAVRFLELDVLKDPLPMDYDVVTSCLFLHHLEEDQAVELLHRMAAAARKLLVVSDLLRGPGGWLLALGAGRVLSRSPVVRVDAVRSVEAAFAPDEVEELARKARLREPRLRRTWPCRFLLTAQGVS